MVQWFVGSPPPWRLAQRYQGENTLPMKAISVRPWAPSSLIASRYHHS